MSVRVNSPPTVSLAPPPAVVQPNKTVTLSAQATDADGTVANVEFFDGATDLGPGVLANGAYALNWTGAAVGAQLGHRRRDRQRRGAGDVGGGGVPRERPARRRGRSRRRRAR